MHELAIAKGFFNIVKKIAKEKNLTKVTKINIRLGVASGIEKKFLEHSLKTHILNETLTEGGELNFIIENIKLVCEGCRKEIGMDISSDNRLNRCPNCNSLNLSISSGKDVYIDSIEGY